ncbi:MAG: shikimate dehydrogenase [Saprospiraceae bacterium]|nr:shikimate dehydrogenase [Saprospiraceae bacterium]
MPHYGLLGKSLQHSFSKSYFENKWKQQGLIENKYNLYELNTSSDLQSFLERNKQLDGLNVTVPYKSAVIPFLDQLTPEAQTIGAVNCIKNHEGGWIGHNTDSLAFMNSLASWLPPGFNALALVCGTGGASKAVQQALNCLKIGFSCVSSSGKGISYGHLQELWDPDWKLIINTTPLGMYPDLDSKPEIPYQKLDSSFLLYDLVYNPEKSLFLRLGANQGARVKNGLEMLHLQADLSWQFWNQ